MPIDAVLVSDVHVDGPTCERQTAFLRFLAGLNADAPPRVCLLGDVFHTWWCRGGEPFSQHDAVVRALADFPLICLAGNHDFHAPIYFGEKGAMVAENKSAIGSMVTTTLGVLSAVLTHGDQVDTSGGYRRLHAVLRSSSFDRVMGMLPVATGWAFLHRLAGHAKGVPSPVAVANQRTLGARLSEGHGLVAMGHTHAPEIVRHPTFTYVNTGDWVEHRTYATVEGGNVELRGFEG